MVSEVVGEWRTQKPRQLPIPGPTKPKSRPKRQKRSKPKSFNTPKSDKLS